MKDLWPGVRLGEVLQRRSPNVNVNTDESYQFAGVYSFGRGVFRGRQRRGSDFSYRFLTRLSEGDFVYPKLMAWEGAFGIVPAACDGFCVSPEFPVFAVDTERLVPAFLGYYFRRPRVWEEVSGKSTGTNVRRRRLPPKELEEHEILVPPVAEQRRIVARIEALEAKLSPVLALRTDANAEGKILPQRVVDNVFRQLDSTVPSIPIGSFLQRSRERITLQPKEQYHGIGTRMWGLGTYIHETRNGSEFDAERYRARLGQLVYNEVWAHNGAVGIIQEPAANTVVSRHFHVFNVDWTNLDQEYLQRVFQAQFFWSACQDGSVSSTGRGHMRRNYFLSVEIPVPTLREQREVVAKLNLLQGMTSRLLKFQADADAELDALLPAVLDCAFKGEL